MSLQVQFRYSEGLKQEVLAGLESGRFATHQEARDHYGIKGADTIPKWIRRHGRHHLGTRVVRVEKPGEADRVLALKRRVAQLERALGQTQAQNLLNDALLKRACELLGQDPEGFKKKNAGGLFTGSSGRDGPVS